MPKNKTEDKETARVCVWSKPCHSKKRKAVDCGMPGRNALHRSRLLGNK